MSTPAPKILVLDDEPNITLLASTLLTMYGYEVTTSNHPHDALAVVKDTRFDVIIVDVMMPGMTGLEFIEEAQKTDLNKDATYTVLTAKVLEGADLAAIKSYNAKLISKPFVPQEFLDILKDLISARN